MVKASAATKMTDYPHSERVEGEADVSEADVVEVAVT